jgi:hypothetical protein
MVAQDGAALVGPAALTLLGPTPEAGRKLLDTANLLKTSSAATEDFIASSAGYLSADWLPCFAAGPGDLECPMDDLQDVPLSATEKLHTIVIRQGTEPAVTLHMVSGPDSQAKPGRFSASPGTIIVAQGNRLSETVTPNSDYPDLAILFDADRKRVLAGPRNLIRSVFTRLMFLGRGYSQIYDREDDERGYGGERVTTWRIDWNDQ